jgi:hypothetical protein
MQYLWVVITAAELFCVGATDFSFAQTSCRVTDPTGTPLNVRTTPNGHVVGTLNNGIEVSVLDHASDRSGKAWVYVGTYDDNKPIGWVYREFIDCAVANRDDEPEQKPLFTADQEACFGRVYDRTHLASHPQQKVTGIHIFRYLSERPEAENWRADQRADLSRSPSVQAFITFNDRPGYFHNWLMCPDESKNGVHCFVECGGGSFDMKRESPTTALLYNHGFIVIGGCGSEVEEGKEVFFQPGEDDRVFRLEKEPVAICRAEEQKALPIPIGKPLRERFKKDEEFCFGRDYDVSHLASHPQQKTSSLRAVGRLDPAGDTVNLDITMTLNRDDPYATAHYSCSPRAASWECHRERASDGYTACNGRTIHLVRARGNDIMLVNRHSGLPIENDCGTASNDPQGPRTSSDDGTFRLLPMPEGACHR